MPSKFMHRVKKVKSTFHIDEVNELIASRKWILINIKICKNKSVEFILGLINYR